MQCRAYVVCVPLAGRTIVRLGPYATWIPTSLWPGKYLRTTAPSAECGTRIVCVCVHNSFTRCCTTDTVLTSTHPHLQFRSCERQRHDRRHEPPVLKKKDGPPLKMFLFVRMSYGTTGPMFPARKMRITRTGLPLPVRGSRQADGIVKQKWGRRRRQWAANREKQIEYGTVVYKTHKARSLRECTDIYLFTRGWRSFASTQESSVRNWMEEAILVRMTQI